MGKLSVKGYASMSFAMDVMTITYCAEEISNTAADAMKRGKEQINDLINSLLKLGVDISDIEFVEEKVRNSYKDDLFVFIKEIKYCTAASLKILEKLIEVINPASNIRYSVNFDFSDVTALENAVIEKAIESSRLRAESIAAKLGKKIIDSESVNFEVRTMEYTTAKNLVKSICIEDDSNPSPEALIALSKKDISKSIDIVWIVE